MKITTFRHTLWTLLALCWLCLCGAGGSAWAAALPSVTLTSPTTGALYASPATVTLTATPTASDGATVTEVDFYSGTTWLGTATAAPYSYSWGNVPNGTYALTAVVTDSSGMTVTSAEVDITVSTMTGLTLSTDKASPQPTGTAITISAALSGPFQNVPMQYKFFTVYIASDGTQVSTTLQDYSSATSCVWTPTMACGSYTLWVFARQVGDSGDGNESADVFCYAITYANTQLTVQAQPASPQAVGTPITLTAAWTNNAPSTMEYNFAVNYHDSTGALVAAVTQAWSSSASLSWTPTMADTAYTVALTAREAGVTFYPSATALLPYSVPFANTALTLTTTPAAPQEINTPLTFNAIWSSGAPSGGTLAYGYSLALQNADGTTTPVLTQAAQANATTLNWTPTSTGTYVITVNANMPGVTTDTQASATATDVVNYINHAPSFTKGLDVRVLENSGALTLPNWATHISAGPPQESSQTLQFHVLNSNAALFFQQPAISPSGTLTFTPNAHAHGDVIVTVTLQDNGGTANGGVDTSAAQVFNIIIAGPPTITLITPTNGMLCTSPAVTLTAQVQDADEPLDHVVFQQVASGVSGVTTLGTVSVLGQSSATPTYSTTIAVGLYSFTATAYSEAGAMATSAPVTVVLAPSGTPNPVEPTSYNYDYTDPIFPLGKLTTITHDQDAPVVLGYAPNGLVNAISTLLPGAPLVRDANGNPTTANYQTTLALGYDSYGDMTQVTTPNANGGLSGLMLSYQAVDEPTSIMDAMGLTTTIGSYDAQGNATAVTDPLGLTSLASFDASDTATFAAGPTQQATMSYQYPGAPLTSVTLANPATPTQAIRTLTPQYDADGNVTSVANAVTPETDTYSGYATTLATKLADGDNQSSTFQTNALGMPVQTTYPDGATDAVTHFDSMGRVTDTQDANGTLTHRDIDGPSGLLHDVQISTGDAYTSRQTYFYYDSHKRVWLTTDPVVDKLFFYDDADDLQTVYTAYTSGSTGIYSIGYVPNTDGSRQSMTTPSGTYSYGYDNDGHLTSLTESDGSVTSWQYTTGRLTRKTLPNGASTVYGYDPVSGRLAGLTNYAPNGTTVLSAYSNFQYDDTHNGQLTDFDAVVANVPSMTGHQNYAYDPTFKRLTYEQFTPSAQQGPAQYDDFFFGGFCYDGAGNMTYIDNGNITYTGNNYVVNLTTNEMLSYNTDNQLTELNPWPEGYDYSYDANGNPWYYGNCVQWFDGCDNLINSFNTFTGVSLSAAYTPDGLRAWKQAGTAAYPTNYLYDGDAPVCELQNNVVTATNVFGADGLVSRIDSRGRVCYLYDPLGNVVQRLDGNGNVLSSDAYDAYGNLLAGGDATDPYGYKGQYGYYTDHETGFILCTHRFYDPVFGRWLTRDKLGYDGGINLYGYCGGDPVGGVDPSGCNNDAVGVACNYTKNTVAFLAGVAVEIPLEVWDNAKHQFLSGELGDPNRMALDAILAIRDDWKVYNVHDAKTFNYWLTLKLGDWAKSEDMVGALSAQHYYEAGRRLTRLILTAVAIEQVGASMAEGLASIRGGSVEEVPPCGAGGPCFVEGTQITTMYGESSIESITCCASNDTTEVHTTIALPIVVIAKEGDINAKYRQVVRTVRADGKVTLTILDHDTGGLYRLTQPVGTQVVARVDKNSGTEVLTRLPSIPEDIDLEKYSFPTVSIETIKKGQQVVTRDQMTGKTEIKTVTRILPNITHEIVQLDLTDKKTGKMVESIRGTPEHPFFTPHGMVAMGQLKPGIEVCSRNTDEPIIVKAVKLEQHPEGVPVYNFETEDNHTYFVGQADGGILVHNSCSLNQINSLIRTGKAPNSIIRADTGKIAHELDHIHFSDGSALNIDGTWKHGGRALTNVEKKWLTEQGWTLPK